MQVCINEWPTSLSTLGSAIKMSLDEVQEGDIQAMRACGTKERGIMQSVLFEPIRTVQIDDVYGLL
jgi:ABC-type methionine transport system permease subunit